MKRTKNAPNPAGMNVREMARRYLQHLEDSGKSQSTLLSYWIDLTVACRELGDETPIEDLTKDKIAAFFDCDAVTKTRTGKEKSPLTVEKTRRVLRMALIWAHEQGLFDEAPVPASAAKKGRSKASVEASGDAAEGTPAAKAKAKNGRDATDAAAEAEAPIPAKKGRKAKGAAAKATEAKSDGKEAASADEPTPAPARRKRRAAKPKPDAEQAEG